MTLDAVVERIADGGNLLENLRLLADMTTWQTSSEVFKAWQEGARIEGVNTANLAAYRLVNGEAVFDLLGKAGNPFMDERFRKDAYHGILRNEFFLPQGEMKEEVLSAIRAGQSTTVKYSDIHLQTEGCSENYGYIEAGKKNTDAEKQLFSAVYGIENPGAGKKIYLLRENVVKSQLKGRAEDVVARACYLYGNLIFIADGRSIFNSIGAVRGVRRVVAEGDASISEPVPSAPLEMTPAHCYDVLLADRQGAVAALDDVKVAGLRGIIADYLAAKAQ